MILKALRKKKERKNACHEVYKTIIHHSRQPCFFEKYQVPDTVDGRFEVLLIHLFLVIERVKKEDTKLAYAFNQELFDLVFRDLDQNLRQIGIGDMSVPKHIKKMAKSFYGRSVSYLDGLIKLKETGESKELYEAFDRNLFAKVKNVKDESFAFFKDYILVQEEHLSKNLFSDIEKGIITFKDYP